MQTLCCHHQKGEWRWGKKNKTQKAPKYQERYLYFFKIIVLIIVFSTSFSVKQRQKMQRKTMTRRVEFMMF